MSERGIDPEQAVVAHDRIPEVPQQTDGAFHDPTPPVSSHCRDHLASPDEHGSFYAGRPIRFPRCRGRLRSGFAIVSFVSNHAHRLLSPSTRREG